ncbi:MAG: hypothetical protein ACJ786_30475 [Catenulispora sp.]
MKWGSAHTAVEDFAKELRSFRDKHGTRPGKEISATSRRLAALQRDTTPANEVGKDFSPAWVSGALAATGAQPPDDIMIFSFVRAVLHTENPDADPVTFEHPDVQELLDLREKACSRLQLGLFRERHLRAALEDNKTLRVQHGCFALHALDGRTLHIGKTDEASETLASRIKATLNPHNPEVDREHVAELEVWPLPDLAGAPDAEATVTRLRDALIRSVIQPTPYPTLHLPHDNASDDMPIPQSRLFPLVDFGTLLAVREALQTQAANLAHHADTVLARTKDLYRLRPS